MYDFSTYLFCLKSKNDKKIEPKTKPDFETLNNNSYEKEGGIFAKLKKFLCCKKKKTISNDWIHKTPAELKKEYPEVEEEIDWDEKTGDEGEDETKDREEGKIEHKLKK